MFTNKQRLLLKLNRSKLHKTQQHRMDMNFATTKYADKIASVQTCGYTQPDFNDLRSRTVEYIDKFDTKSWYDNPIQTVLLGKPLNADDDTKLSTIDSFNQVNGSIIHSSRNTIEKVINHLATYQGKKDYRDEVRKIEKDLLSNEIACQLVGNQALDFHKQDGITEIEEAHLANIVERGLNDLLIESENEGKTVINRSPALVGAVSNFSNFLDLFRKTIRNIELGVPVAVLSRSNTTQHVYRWAMILLELMAKHGVDSGMLTYVSCDVNNQREIMKKFPDSPLYFTGSRPVAKLIKEVCPKLMASTGGPNTLVSSVLNTKIEDAIRMSCAIENSGQCTALRHVVVPPTDNFDKEVVDMFDQITYADTARDSLNSKTFFNVIKTAPFKLEDGYKSHPTRPIGYRIKDALPSGQIDEHWRQIYLDFTQSKINSELIENLSDWLITNQPISLAVNGDTYDEAYGLAKQLFERTALVVYTIGCTESPALTCQARPQDGEVFGEFPPRKEMDDYCKFPVIVPSSTPGYNTNYSKSYLQQNSVSSIISSQVSYWTGNANVNSQTIIQNIESVEYKTYARLIAEYLSDALQINPKNGFGPRTALWGLQTIPQSRQSVIRIGEKTSFDLFSVYFLPFFMTNANGRISVSINESNKKAIQLLTSLKIPFVTQSNDEYTNYLSSEKSLWGIIDLSTAESQLFDFPLVGHFISTLLPLGHIKSTKSNDKKFIEVLSDSEKWLRIRD